jgi:predicted  nucleic acid-binding Zn-ribbon protein
MPLQLTELWNLQQIDSESYRLKRERGRLNDGAALREAWQAAVKGVEALETRLRKLRADMADAELESKKIEGKKADYERRLYQGKVTNPKELTAMEQEIAMFGRQRGRLDETLLTLMDGIETTSAELAAATAGRDAAKALEPPTLARYENLRGRLSNVAVARFVDGTCEGCHTRLASMISRKLHEGTSYTYCENCTRFLIPGAG